MPDLKKVHFVRQITLGLNHSCEMANITNMNIRLAIGFCMSNPIIMIMTPVMRYVCPAVHATISNKASASEIQRQCPHDSLRLGPIQTTWTTLVCTFAWMNGFTTVPQYQ